MLLREHPLMTRKSGYANWPPQWMSLSWTGAKINGEVGVLEEATMNDLITNKIFIRARDQGACYMAVLAFDDVAFAQQLCRLLLQSTGRSIRQIGDLDLSHML